MDWYGWCNYFAWWRSQYPSVDESESDPVALAVYEEWKNWNNNLSQDIVNQVDYTTTLNSHKTTITELQSKKNFKKQKSIMVTSDDVQ